MYDRLVAMKASTPTLSQHKWLEDCNLRQNDINWSAAYQLASKITKSTKLREFQFRLLHRRLPTNDFLTKIRIKEDPQCSFCKEECEKLIHLFWTELPYNGAVLGRDGSASKNLSNHPRRFFFG